MMNKCRENTTTNAKKTQDAKFIEGKCRFVFMLIARSTR